MEVDLDDSWLSSEESREDSLRTAFPAASARKQKSLNSEYQRVMQAVSKTSRYSPEMKLKGWRLGKGGCFTTVERCEHWTRKGRVVGCCTV